LLTLTLLLLAGCAAVHRLFADLGTRAEEQSKFRLPASYAKAGNVALADFLEAQKRRVDALADAGVSSPLLPAEPGDAGLDAAEDLAQDVAFARCFLQPEAYDLEISFERSAEAFRVSIIPVPEICLGSEAGALRGGGSEYEIDARSYVVRTSRLLE
jgi:hypothetical protein